MLEVIVQYFYAIHFQKIERNLNQMITHTESNKLLIKNNLTKSSNTVTN